MQLLNICCAPFVFSSHRAFDVELLYIAQCFKIPIAEVAVNWTEIEGGFSWNMWTCITVPLICSSINISAGCFCKSVTGTFYSF